MDILNEKDCKRFLKNGKLSKPFLESSFVKEKVMKDYDAKIKERENYTEIESLCLWIKHNVKCVGDDEEFLVKNKFQRTAKQIWESKKATGCTDYALLFVTFARQLGFSATLLHTAEFSWISRLQNNGDYKVHYGHTFCECFYKGRWVLVDPTRVKIEFDYNPDCLKLNYLVGESSVFVPYFRGLDLGVKQSVKQHNEQMEQECINLELEAAK